MIFQLNGISVLHRVQYLIRCRNKIGKLQPTFNIHLSLNNSGSYAAKTARRRNTAFRPSNCCTIPIRSYDSSISIVSISRRAFTAASDIVVSTSAENQIFHKHHDTTRGSIPVDVSSTVIFFSLLCRLQDLPSFRRVSFYSEASIQSQI